MRSNLHQNPSYRKFPNAQESSPHHYRMKVRQFPCVGIFTRPHYTTPLPNEGTNFHAQKSSPHHYPLPNEGIQKNRSVIFIKILYGKGSKRGGANLDLHLHKSCPNFCGWKTPYRLPPLETYISEGKKQAGREETEGIRKFPNLENT